MNNRVWISLSVAFVLGFALVREAGLRANRVGWNKNVSGQAEVPTRRMSHAKHDSLGIGCLYCHTEVRTGSGAGLPSAATCLDCHSVPMPGEPAWLDTLRSLGPEADVRWDIHVELPAGLRFDHSVHGTVDCASCHGTPAETDRNPGMGRQSMQNCLDCHKDAHPAAGGTITMECSVCHR